MHFRRGELDSALKSAFSAYRRRLVQNGSANLQPKYAVRRGRDSHLQALTARLVTFVEGDHMVNVDLRSWAVDAVCALGSGTSDEPTAMFAAVQLVCAVVSKRVSQHPLDPLTQAEKDDLKLLMSCDPIDPEGWRTFFARVC